MKAFDKSEKDHQIPQDSTSLHEVLLDGSGAFSKPASDKPNGQPSFCTSDSEQTKVLEHRLLGGTIGLLAEGAAVVLAPEITFLGMGALAIVGAAKGGWEGAKTESEYRGLAIGYGALFGTTMGLLTPLSIGEKAADLVSPPECVPDTAFLGHVDDPLKQLPWRLDFSQD